MKFRIALLLCIIGYGNKHILAQNEFKFKDKLNTLNNRIPFLEKNTPKFRFNLETYSSKATGAIAEKPSLLVSHYENGNGLHFNNILFQIQDGISDTNSTKKYRYSIAISAGDFTKYNQSKEIGIGKNLQELYFGQKIGSFWLDYGVFSSHIGMETALGYDCINLTRSIQADNSPYYERGLRLSYETKNKNWYIAMMTLNGWQKIDNPSIFNAVGHQIKYTKNKLLINSSSYIGKSPTAINKNRFFHNLYFLYKINSRMNISSGIDFGAEFQNRITATTIKNRSTPIYIAPILLIHYQLKSNLFLGGRYEYFRDANYIIVNNQSLRRIHGFSGNLDWKMNTNNEVRLEFREFLYNNFNISEKRINSFITISYIYNFQK